MSLMLLSLMLLPVSAANAEPQASEEVKTLCRQALRNVCKLTFPPNREALWRCVDEKRNELPTQCVAFIDAQRKSQ